MADPAPQLPDTFDANKAVSLSLGLASPLWFAFAGAAVAGSAFWWMSRWTRPDNLEAMLELPTPAPQPAAVVETAAVAAQPVAQIAAKAAETAVDIAAAETAALVEGLTEVDPVVEAKPVVEAGTAPATAAAGPAKVAADDLTKLVGVGPKLAASLADVGITSFAQIAAWTADDLAKFDEALSLKGRAARDAWVAQARRFAEA
jgi:predicted flap endonuclease-1-like 5' DNA nuclease